MTREEELARCDEEISTLRAMILAENPARSGLLLGLVDWYCERRLIEAEEDA